VKVGSLVKDDWGMGMVISIALSGTMVVFWFDDQNRSTYLYNDEVCKQWKVLSESR
jgi:hypothetical protein